MGRLATYGLRITGMILLIIILSQLQLGAIAVELANTNIYWISIAILLVIPTIYLRALRWRYALSVLRIKTGRLDAFQMHLASSFIGQITPGRLGEFIKVLYIKAPMHKTVISVLVDRLFDLAVLVILSAIGISLLPTGSLKPAILIGTSLIGVIIISTILVARHLPWIVSKTLGFILPKQIGEKTLRGTSGLKTSFRAYKAKDYAVMTGYTVLSYIIYYMIFYAAAQAIGLVIPLIYLISCLAITSIVSFLPISFLGIGTRDISLVFLFTLLGISSESAVAYSTLILIINIAGALFGAIAWLKRPIQIKSP